MKPQKVTLTIVFAIDPPGDDFNQRLSELLDKTAKLIAKEFGSFQPVISGGGPVLVKHVNLTKKDKIGTPIKK